MTRIKISTLGLVSVLITAIIIIAGLWPFDFNPVNKVDWLQKGNGIRFYGQGMVISRQPLNFGTDHSATGSISVEILALPHKESTNTVASIVTLYDHEREVFLAGQWISELIVRVPAVNAERHNRYGEIGIANALTKNVMHFITVVSEKGSTAIYLDGKLEKIVNDFSLMPIGKELSGHLLLGNSADGTHAWNGAISGLAFYDRALNDEEIRNHYTAWQQGHKSILQRESKPHALYFFDEQGGNQIQASSFSGNPLLIPDIFQPLRRTILHPPWNEPFFGLSNLTDVAVNIVGFIPFGLVLSAWLRLSKNFPATRVYLFSILIGALISLAIELTQVYLPTRDSSLMDVFSNILGTASGILLFKYALPFLNKYNRDRMLSS